MQSRWRRGRARTASRTRRWSSERTSRSPVCRRTSTSRPRRGVVAQRHQAAAVVVARQVEHDRAEVGGRAVGGGDPVGVPGEPEEGLLDEVLGGVAIVDEERARRTSERPSAWYRADDQLLGLGRDRLAMYASRGDAGHERDQCAEQHRTGRQRPDGHRQPHRMAVTSWIKFHPPQVATTARPARTSVGPTVAIEHERRCALVASAATTTSPTERRPAGAPGSARSGAINGMQARDGPASVRPPPRSASLDQHGHQRGTAAGMAMNMANRQQPRLELGEVDAVGPSGGE